MAGATALIATKGRAERDQPLRIFAAASLKTVLDQLVALKPDVETAISYGGSGLLARQISLGAPADLFISADPSWIDTLPDVSDAVLAAHPALDHRRALFSNRLVLIAPKGRAQVALEDIAAGTRIAMGLVEAVPAGRYGKAALETLGLWERLGPSVVEVDNVRAALALVARGELPFGLVYASDALAEPKVDVVARFAETSHPQILYELFVPAQARLWHETDAKQSGTLKLVRASAGAEELCRKRRAKRAGPSAAGVTAGRYGLSVAS